MTRPLRSVGLSKSDRKMLALRDYVAPFTPVPNRVLSEQLKRDLSNVYSALTDAGLPAEGFTYAVIADEDGQLRHTSAPKVCRLSASNDDDRLAIRWGDETLPIPDSATPQFEDDGYGSVCASLQIGSALEMTCKIIPADWENPPTLAQIQADGPAAHLGIPAVQSTGPLVPVAQLPLGTYQLTGARSWHSPKHGKAWQVDVVVPADHAFDAEVSVRDEATGEWSKQTVRIEPGICRVKANQSLRDFLDLPNAVVAAENPATLRVLEHGEYQGHRTARIAIRFAHLPVSDQSNTLSLDF